MASSLTTFKFDREVLATIEDLKRSTKATSRAEIIRRAITLMKLVQDAKEKGETIILRSKRSNGRSIEREIVVP
jgi:hypothetical protein